MAELNVYLGLKRRLCLVMALMVTERCLVVYLCKCIFEVMFLDLELVVQQLTSQLVHLSKFCVCVCVCMWVFVQYLVQKVLIIF